MTPRILILAVLLAAGAAQAQTIKTKVSDWTNSIFTASTSWNFIEAASNLTVQEKQMFNERATAMQSLPFMGMSGVDIVVCQVKALDAQREIEKILERLRAVTQECTRPHCTNNCPNCGTWKPWASDHPGIIGGGVPNDAAVEKGQP